MEGGDGRQNGGQARAVTSPPPSQMPALRHSYVLGLLSVILQLLLVISSMALRPCPHSYSRYIQRSLITIDQRCKFPIQESQSKSETEIQQLSSIQCVLQLEFRRRRSRCHPVSYQARAIGKRTATFKKIELIVWEPLNIVNGRSNIAPFHVE